MASNRRRQSERAKGEVLAIRLNLDGELTLAQARDSFAVVLTRVSPRGFDDDNNAAALKSVRDGMAKRWGIDDGDPRITWIPTARTGKAHAVEAALWVVPDVAKPLGTVSPTEVEGLSMSRDCGEYCTCGACIARYSRKPAPSDVEVDASDYERPPRVVVHGGLIQRREVRVTPNVVRAKGGA